MTIPSQIKGKIIVALVVIGVFIFQRSSISGGLPDSEAITGINWAWQQTRNDTGNEVTPPTPARYTINFKNKGTFDIQADCNWGGGTYAIEGNSISVEITHTTKAICPPESLERTFIQHLNASENFYFKDDVLFLELKGGLGTMKLME